MGRVRGRSDVRVPEMCPPGVGVVQLHGKCAGDDGAGGCGGYRVGGADPSEQLGPVLGVGAPGVPSISAESAGVAGGRLVQSENQPAAADQVLM